MSVVNHGVRTEYFPSRVTELRTLPKQIGVDTSGKLIGAVMSTSAHRPGRSGNIGVIPCHIVDRGSIPGGTAA